MLKTFKWRIEKLAVNIWEGSTNRSSKNTPLVLEV